MENLTVEHFVSLVEMHRYIGYLVLFIAMVLEGETVLILAGALAQLDAFDIGDVLLIAFSGIVLGNVVWYSVGYYLSHKSFAQGMIARAEKIIFYFLPHFRERPFKSIFFSKFIYGANRATVFVSGVFKVDFRVFFKAEVLASVLWVGLYAALGYFFGYIAIQFTHKASRVALIIFIFVVVSILLEKLLSSYYERRQLEQAKKDHHPQR